jgi:DNA-binding Lrp family transcriptional regulator
MSKKTKIPISTLFDRLRSQEQQETILKHTTLIDFDALGYTTRVQLALRSHPTTRNQLQQHLTCHEHINNVYEVAQGYDFLAEGIFMYPKEVKAFISNLQQKFPTVEYTTHYITKDLKREGFLAA